MPLNDYDLRKMDISVITKGCRQYEGEQGNCIFPTIKQMTQYQFSRNRKCSLGEFMTHNFIIIIIIIFIRMRFPHNEDITSQAQLIE